MRAAVRGVGVGKEASESPGGGVFGGTSLSGVAVKKIVDCQNRVQNRED